ncbi:MAG: OmpH family outer membrane protein [Bacteroidales bacterium]|nr:OmpH family outer membrane protein [Bacteroidales bacterium]MDD3666976.1 OmpH family outer membrane protein [Bacteroidales bacterium]
MKTRPTNSFLLITQIVLFLCVCLAFFFKRDSNDIAYIDVNLIMEKAEPMKMLRADLDQLKSKENAKVDSLVKLFEGELKSFEKERSSLTAKEVSLKEELLRRKHENIVKYQEWTKKNLVDEENKRSQSIYNDMNDIIKEYAENRSFDLILGANGSGNLLYGKENANITTDILNQINQEYASRKKKSAN